MANPTRFPIFREGDLGIKDGPVDGAALREAFRKLFGQLNPGLDAANRGTSKGLTLSDNIKCDIITGTFTHGVAQNFALTNLTKANSARVLSWDTQIPIAAPAIRMVTGTTKPQASVTLFFADSTATNASVTLELLPEGSQTSSIPSFVPNWIAPTLLNSWAAFGGGFLSPGFFKDQFGVVHLRGTISNAPGTLANAGVFVLPTGYRPSATLISAAQNVTAVAGAYQRLNIDSAGNVFPTVAIAAGTILSIDCITFDTRA